MTYRYQLKLKSSRECVDLREYKGEITSAVRIGLGVSDFMSCHQIAHIS